MLTAPSSGITAQSYTPAPKGDAKKKENTLYAASQELAKGVNRLPKGTSIAEALEMITACPQFRGLIVNHNSFFVTTSDYNRSKTMSSFEVHNRIHVEERGLEWFKKSLGDKVKEIDGSGGNVYVSIADLITWAQAQQSDAPPESTT
jgi:hypothetical protein